MTTEAGPVPLWLLNEEPTEESIALAALIREGDELLRRAEADKENSGLYMEPDFVI